MRLHDRMVLGFFFRVILFCVVGFIIIFVLTDLFEKMDNFIDNQARLSSIIHFYLFKLPDIVRLTLPVDVLLATLFTLGVMAKNNEVVALLASGVSMLRITLPILVAAVFLAALSAALSELIVPRTNARMQRINRVEILKHAPIDAPVRYDFNYRGQGGYVYHVRVLNTETRTMKGVTLSQAEYSRVVMRLDAAEARWVDGLWEFQDGVLRTFGPESRNVPDAAEAPGHGGASGRTNADSTAPASSEILSSEIPSSEIPSAATPVAGEKAEAFRTLRMSELKETPEDLARIEPQPNAMNYRELRAHVERVRQSGASVNDYVVDMYMKISDPFTVIVLSVLGIGLSARKKKASLAAGFGLTLVIGFTYLAMAQIGAALGKNETLPPVLAAWLPQLVFGITGLTLITRANR